jgi:hypothetical protein
VVYWGDVGWDGEMGTLEKNVQDEAVVVVKTAEVNIKILRRKTLMIYELPSDCELHREYDCASWSVRMWCGMRTQLRRGGHEASPTIRPDECRDRNSCP